MKGVARDPRIKDHSPQKLRWFANAFRERAERDRAHAQHLDEKAARYIKRAEKLEKMK